MNPAKALRLTIHRQDLQKTCWVPDPDAPEVRSLQPGQARLQVQRFALTANNITYAAFGRAMKYWDFFPAPDVAWGCLPVWGFAVVQATTVPALGVGQRVYGYWPAGTHLVVQPDRINPRGFVDAAPHRQGLASVYNQYRTVDTPFAMGGAAAQEEGQRAVLQPLFMTAFLLDDFLADNQFFGAQQLLLSSASSKTALATAHGLLLRRGTPGHPRVIGLTSANNLAYVQSLGCYDQVVIYEDVSLLSAQHTSVYVDFAGSASLRLAVHSHFGDQLRFSSAIGGTHWEGLGPGGGLPGPRPVLFFAPEQVRKRAEPPPVGWGREGLDQRLAQAWQHFLKPAVMGAEPWVRIVEQAGAPAIDAVYHSLLKGGVDPRQGHMLTLSA